MENQLLLLCMPQPHTLKSIFHTKGVQYTFVGLNENWNLKKNHRIIIGISILYVDNNVGLTYSSDLEV